MRFTDLIVVDGLVPTELDDTNLREEAWSLALDQRHAGPRKLLVAFGDLDGRFRGMAIARRTDPPELALEPCIQYLGAGAEIAIAYCDEPVTMGPPPPDIAQRWSMATSVCDSHGIRLVDWFACDDEAIRSFKLALHPDEPWWPAP